MPELVTEAVEAAGSAVEQGGGVFLVDLITPGWGSSGYYAPAVLEQAATDRVFPAGLHMFIDHQTAQERNDRPEGSLRDLAGVLLEDARWNPNGGDGAGALEARVRVFSGWRTPLAEMRDAIGVSIRASADVGFGEAEGRQGRLIERIIASESVDFVTRPGRGGRIVEVLESQRVEEARNIGQWVESRIHRDFTILTDDIFGEGHLTRDERIGLSAAIGDALAAFVARLEADHPQLYTRDLWDDPVDTVATALEAAKNVPVVPAGRTTQESTKEDTMPEIEEARLRQLETDAGRATVLESERDAAIAERDEAVAERDEARREVREATVARVIAEAAATFDELQVAGLRAVAESLTDEDGRLDVDAFTAKVTEAAAKVAAEAGAGKPRGLGQRPATTSEAVTLTDLDESIDATFGGPIIKEA